MPVAGDQVGRTQREREGERSKWVIMGLFRIFLFQVGGPVRLSYEGIFFLRTSDRGPSSVGPVVLILNAICFSVPVKPIGHDVCLSR